MNNQKMKTNQLMSVNLGSFGSVNIWHKDMMGKADDIISIGNHWRREKGLKEIELHSILKKQDFWEFIIELNAKKVSSVSNEAQKVSVVSTDSFIYSDYSLLDNFKNKSGQLKYSEIIKMFPNLIRVQKRGKAQNIGTWVNLYLLLKIATYLSKALEVEIYDVFIKGKILEHRDNGGNAFKELNNLIDTLEDRTRELKPKGNKGVYIQIAKLVRDKLNILSTRGYNKEEHDSIVQSKREEIIKFSCNMIKMQMIKTYPQLKTFIINYPI